MKNLLTKSKSPSWSVQIYNSVIWAKHQVIIEEKLCQNEIDKIIDEAENEAINSAAQAPPFHSNLNKINWFKYQILPPILDRMSRRIKHSVGIHMVASQKVMKRALDDSILMRKRKHKVTESAYELAHGPEEEPDSLEGLIPFEDVPVATYESLLTLGFMTTSLEVWAKSLKPNSLEGIAAQFAKGLELGESMDEIARRLQHQFGMPRLSAMRMARTGIQAAANQMQLGIYQANQKLIKSLVFTATLDVRTCPVCGGYDGNEYPQNTNMPYIPVHIMCRCSYAPRMKSAKELGLGDIQLGPGMRESMDGLVPESLKYEQWAAMPENVERIKQFKRDMAKKYYKRAKKKKKLMVAHESIDLGSVVMELLHEATKRFEDGIKECCHGH